MKVMIGYRFADGWNVYRCTTNSWGRVVPHGNPVAFIGKTRQTRSAYFVEMQSCVYGPYEQVASGFDTKEAALRYVETVLRLERA